MTALKVASFNLGNAKPVKVTADDLDMLVDLGVDLIDPQEAFDRADVIAAWLKRHRWRDVPFEHGRGDTPQLYNPKRLELLGHREHVVNDRPVHVGDKGAGPSTIHPKYVTDARFVDLETDVRLRSLNTHPLASWTRHDLPDAEQRARRALAALHFRVVAEAVRQAHTPLVVLGMDGNGPRTADLMRPVVKLLDLGRTGPTAHGAPIDFVGVKGAQRTRRRTLDGTTSDHKPVVATIKGKA